MRRIGLDFDNTIICYDEVFRNTAIDWQLLPENFVGNKQQVRDAIRLLPEGELSWQRLQGFVYGRGIGGATAFDGLRPFLALAAKTGDTVLVVSHKTEYGHFDPQRVNLRHAALGWMRDQGLFDYPGLSADLIHFETTRAEKIARIVAEKCDIFIDDLEEVLSDPAFPSSVDRILFSAGRSDDQDLPYPVCADWQAIEEKVFR